LVRETGHANRVADLSGDNTDVSRGGEINDRGKRMGELYLERMTLKLVTPGFKEGKFRDEQYIRI